MGKICWGSGSILALWVDRPEILSLGQQLSETIGDMIAHETLDKICPLFMSRIFKSTEFFQPTTTEPLRSVVAESENGTIVAWYINPGQTIPPHIHPNGQDTWTILSGTGQYYLDQLGNHKTVVAGDVVIATPGDVHGVHNHGDQPLTFISIVAPLEAGYQLIKLATE